MSFNAATLRRLDLEPPEAVLRKLGALAAVAEPSAFADLPQATLLLAGGHYVKGKILRFAPHEPPRAGDVVLVYLDDAPTQTEICYVPLQQVMAVSLRLPLAYLPTFSSGRIRYPAKAPPSRLELQREARDAGERWSKQLDHPMVLEIDWAAWPDDEDHRGMLSDTILALDRLLHRFAEEAAAREAISQGIDRFVMTLGGERAVSLTQRRLTITLAGEPTELAAFDEADLRREIERRL